jgi:hypothetical protein
LGDQPGILAQGPEEKKGLAGRRAGRFVIVMETILPDGRPSLGRGSPEALIIAVAYAGKHALLLLPLPAVQHWMQKRAAVNCFTAA